MAFFVAFEEKFCPDDALGIDDESAGVRNAAESLWRLFVANTISINRLAAGVREKRICDGVVRGKSFECGSGIIADSRELAAGRFDFLQVCLQLDQLLFAIGSPIRRAVEDQRHRAFLKQRLEGNIAVVLVFECEGRSFLANAQAGLFGRGSFDRECDRRKKEPAGYERCGELDCFHDKT